MDRYSSARSPDSRWLPSVCGGGPMQCPEIHGYFRVLRVLAVVPAEIEERMLLFPAARGYDQWSS